MTSGGLASIHHQHVAVNVGGGVGSQKDRCAFQVIVGAKTARRNVAEQIVFLVFDHFARHMRGKPSRCDGVDLNVMPRPLYRQIVRKGNDSAFAGVICNGLHCLRRCAPDPGD